MRKGHNYGLCKICGKLHIHPRGTLGKNLEFDDIERRSRQARINAQKCRKMPLTQEMIDKVDELYNEEELTQAEIADLFSVNQGTIHNFMKEVGIETRPQFRFEKGHLMTEKQLNALLEKGAEFRLKKGQKLREGTGNKIKCEYCSIEAKYPPSFAKRWKLHFCSRECYKKYKKEHPELMVLPSPNKGEKDLLSRLEKMSIAWRFVGDGKLWIGGKCPDFWDGDHHIIELFGERWHTNKDREERIEHFRKHGYNCMIIWYLELRNIEDLKNEITEWWGGKIICELPL